MTLKPMPEYVASNLTDEEFLDILEPCLPPAIYERVRRMKERKPSFAQQAKQNSGGHL